MKFHVFGDTGGHAKQLLNALTTIGVDLEKFIIPKDTTIIHMGDLIHKGPASDYLVSLVHILQTKNPGQWIQLLGNHEYQHLGGPSFWRCECSPEMVMIMRDWVEKGVARTAFGADDLVPEKLSLSNRDTWEPNNSSWLFTHAGLTRQFWKSAGSLKLAEAVADKLNSMSVKKLNTAGKILFGGADNFYAGPVWAIGVDEVYGSWTKTPGPAPVFNQAFGHTTPYAWPRRNWYAGGVSTQAKEFRNNSKINPDKRMVITKVGNEALFLSLDPGFSGSADILEQPFVTFTQWGI